MNNDRFSGLPWVPSSDSKIYTTVGGAGGIGSYLSYFLARGGFIPYVWDLDTIEETNLSGQLFPQDSVGFSKVTVLSKVISNFTGVEIFGRQEWYDETSETSPICFSAFDNMVARTVMFENWVRIMGEQSEYIQQNAIFIDGRLEAEGWQVYSVPFSEEKIALYRETLFGDEEVSEVACTMKQTSHFAAMIATIMFTTFTNHRSNVKEGFAGRTVPFCQEFFGPMFMTNMTL